MGEGSAEPLEDVMSLVRSVPEWAAAELRVVALDGGITNRNYRVDVDGSSYVIRLPGERTELLGIDRAGEVEAARRAAALGIGPPVFGVLAATGTVITEFVAGVALADPVDMLAAGRLELVVDAVATLHRSGPIGRRFPIFRVVERHAVDAVANGVTLPPEHWDLARTMGRIEAVFTADGCVQVPCHNDLLPANVLFAPDRAWLIDYEYSGMNDAMFDLANLSVNVGLDGTADDRMLQRYAATQRDVTQRDVSQLDVTRARLALMKVVSEMREGMWALVQQGISSLAGFDFARYAADRLDSCGRRAASSDFADALGVAHAAREPGRPVR